MKNGRRLGRLQPGGNTALVIGLLLAVSGTARSESFQSGEETDKGIADWRIQVDNDALAAGSRDRNYTGGFLFSQSGAPKTFSLDRGLGFVDRLAARHRTIHG